MTRTASPSPTARRSLATAVTGAVAGAVLLTASPALASTTQSAASVQSSSPGDAEKSVVLVGIDWTGYVQYPTTDGSWAWSGAVQLTMGCTGWFASDDGRLVTAGHCLDPEEVKDDIRSAFLEQNDALDMAAVAADWQVAGWETAQPDRDDVWVVQPSAVAGAVIQDPTTVQVLDWQPAQDGDLALLKVNGLTEATTPLPVATGEPAVGDPVMAVGYPASVMQVSDVSRLRASFKSGTVSSAQVSETGVPGLEINADISGGMSGGPTVDANGAVLGVNSFTIRGEEQSFNFITDSAALRSYLDEHDVPQVAAVRTGATGAGGPTSASGATPLSAAGFLAWPFLAGGGLLVLLFVAGGAYLVARRRPVAAAAPAAGGTVEATRLIDRPVVSSPPPAPGPVCRHLGNPPAARFCLDCGSPLAA